MKSLLISLVLILLCAQYAYSDYPTSGSSQDAYCQVPPYVTQNVKPNINLVLDFSGSMQMPAYLGCSSSAAYDSSKVLNCGNPSLDSTTLYSADSDYYGFFKNNTYYKYDTTKQYFVENSSCTNTDRVGSISSNCLSGNLLNWAVTTRTDVLRKILTGGRLKYSTTDVLESEGSRYSETDTNLHCVFTVSANSTTTRLLSVANQRYHTCSIGTFSNYNIDVNTTTPSDIKGVVNSLYPNQADLELSVFNTTVNTVYRVGKNKDLQKYLDAINSELAYNGTPTGEALRESEYFFQQSSNLSSTNEAVVLGKGNYKYDPYYDPDNPTTPTKSLPVPCRKSFDLLISDGEWNGSIDPVRPAYAMHKSDLRSDISGDQNVSTYTVYAFGDSTAGRNAMITTALFGGFEDNDSNNYPYPFNSLPYSSLSVNYPLASCDPLNTWNSGCAEWDKYKKGLPYNYFEADNGEALQSAIESAVQDILGQVTSGTASSVLGNSTNGNMMLLQAMYYPSRNFEKSTETSWTGELDSLWYYVDDSLDSNKMTIREDSVQNKQLDLLSDKIINFNSDGPVRCDVSTDLTAGSCSQISLDDIRTLWRGGYNPFSVGDSLWSRSYDNRKVYTNNLSGISTSNNMMSFSTGNRDLLKTYLDIYNAVPATFNADAENVINFILGADLNSIGYRNRTVALKDSSGAMKYNVWKLGDIINSTPKMLSSTKLNSFDDFYEDDSYRHFSLSTNYLNRGVAFTGANDGMLHAFKMGKYVDLAIKNPDGSSPTELGKELWGYVPENVLPYLKHLGNPAYRHLFYVDSTPTIFDASIGKTSDISCDDGITGPNPYYICKKETTLNADNSLDFDGTSWRSVLIGSMGLGGATRNKNATCTDCVKTPVDGIGYSSYFAMDVTDPLTPKLLWEFSNPGLGFSTVKPAIVRIKDPADDGTIGNPARNGRWFVVLASGPTGPVDAASNQMKGYSDQPLNIFVLDLKTGTPLRTFSAASSQLISGVGHTQFSDMPLNAFGGIFSDSSIDTDLWDISRPGSYSDDAVYLGYTRKDTSALTFTKGGVLRILTGDDPDPAKWKVSTVIDGIGPVTSAVKKLQSYSKDKSGKLWLYFGTGRYFYKMGTQVDEDYSGQQEALYGVQDRCYDVTTNDLDNVNCTEKVTASDLVDQTSTITAIIPATKKGWFINLAKASGNFHAKRVITNPVTSWAGVVFFTAFQPSADVCSYGGQTSLWAVKYDNGGSISGLMGQSLLQLSTGATEQSDLAKMFTESNSRETIAFPGVPSKDEPPIFSNASHYPTKKILQIWER